MWVIVVNCYVAKPGRGIGIGQATFVDSHEVCEYTAFVKSNPLEGRLLNK